MTVRSMPAPRIVIPEEIVSSSASVYVTASRTITSPSLAPAMAAARPSDATPVISAPKAARPKDIMAKIAVIDFFIDQLLHVIW